ncbi:DUF3857 domain-containing protein [Mucilaginibacter sp. KACC 22063]|uniref:DUF3857 domain-containing protein n=1 Tax=Mucilaginibacter sp. KACC 22063 TaxID=3025666 RepID=UPI002366C529|nr:DUF3857 domain-containing protein [Mucilaginibacter sp. KACC 22063]WDF55327.1 DUF3857 domain-containing protein [Mucilaginibacter sp. KACC 22063]
MRATLPLLICALAQLSSYAQTPNPIQAFGKIDKADLELKSCEFEKDANAMVLFEKATVSYDNNLNVIVEEHRRIKIFNDNGKNEANIKIEYDGGNKFENITGLQAETINLNNDKVEITKVEKAQIFTQVVDKVQNLLTFTFPNVKPGSVIEYKYKRTINSYRYIPAWYFQSNIPTKYSELITEIPDWISFRTPLHLTQDFVKNTRSSSSGTIGSGPDAFNYYNDIKDMALENVHSLPDEPYMSSSIDNLEGISFELLSVRPMANIGTDYASTWPKVGEAIINDEDFGSQIRRSLLNEATVIAKAKTFKTDDERINYVFNQVRDNLKWNNSDAWYTNIGTKSAWEKKSGNATEINLILCHLLKQAGVKAYPMVVSTREHGKVTPASPFIGKFNRAVVYIPVDSAKNYVLDASNKYNAYNEIPESLLNSFGLMMDKENSIYDLKYLVKSSPTRRTIFVNASIDAGGAMSGTASINNYSYYRLNNIKSYKTDGEKKYLEMLANHDNNLKITDLKMMNMDQDSLPLSQTMNFKLDLTSSDGSYIYFAPNLFTALNNNPFLSENRYTDIQFGYINDVSMNGLYKIPAGYKIDALPKSVNMVMPDKSISFKRYVVEQDGTVMIRYSISYEKSTYFKEDYATLHEFYKKLQEMLNEQIVLKKS